VGSTPTAGLWYDGERMRDRVFVGNLNYSSTESDLKAAFEENGIRVKEATIVTDRETGQSRGFGFVTLLCPVADAIAKMDGVTVTMRPIRVSEAHERAPAGGGGGPRNFQGGGGDRGREQEGGGRRRGRDRDRDRDSW
jgi:RNA recognition motif-containing protein